MAAVFIITFTEYAKKLRSLNVFQKDKNNNRLTAKKCCRKCSKLQKSTTTYSLRDEEEDHENRFYIRKNLTVHNELWKQAFVYAGR